MAGVDDMTGHAAGMALDVRDEDGAADDDTGNDEDALVEADDE